jgi:hypothetical protein
MKPNKKLSKEIAEWRKRQRRTLDRVKRRNDRADKLPMKELAKRLRKTDQN